MTTQQAHPARPDILLYGLSQTAGQAQLLAWAQTTPGLHEMLPDFHRLQLEFWLWKHRSALGHRVLDVGVYIRRDWLGPGYRTFGEHNEDTRGDLLAMPFANDSFDGVILTEVLEHCINPWLALEEVRRALKPGGLLLVTSPFFWPEHGVDGQYKDYWRFTRNAWEALLAPFAEVSIEPCRWTNEGAFAYDLMRRFECFGLHEYTQATTGYLCSARKPCASS